MNFGFLARQLIEAGRPNREIAVERRAKMHEDWGLAPAAIDAS